VKNKRGGFGRGEKIKDCKERGEWAELVFMARVAGEGLKVLKPCGDSLRYDVAVEGAGKILRVQVKSTLYLRKNREYSLNVLGPKRKKYADGELDFFAVYVIPVDVWYIIPFDTVGRKNRSLHFTPSNPHHKYAEYREAWHLLRGGKTPERVERIFACVEGAEGQWWWRGQTSSPLQRSTQGRLSTPRIAGFADDPAALGMTEI
jgi:PD-(D/E)XK endonuclease